MRYLILFLLFFSQLLFSDTPPSPPLPVCGAVATTGCTSNQYISGSMSFCNSFCANGSCAKFVRGAPEGVSPRSCTGSETIPYACVYGCMCPTGMALVGGVCSCSDPNSQLYNTPSGGRCGPKTCPAGESISTHSSGGNWIVSCVKDGTEEPENPDDLCPSGYPKVNGECPVCPLGFNPDGTCIGGSCPSDQITQGYVNGHAVCIGKCTAPQVWGSVNGVEGCHGDPACPAGQTYGTISFDGVTRTGCWCFSGDCNGGGSASSSGGAGGSSGSGGAGGSSGSGGAGGSSGSGGAGGSSGSGGGGGGGGSGGGTGGNNSVGADYPDNVPCPPNFVKEGSKCVAPNNSDCPAKHHQVVISPDPFIFWCVPDDPPKSSSSSQQASSQPSSESQSSQRSSQQTSSTAAGSSGSNTSSGSGGTGGGDGEGEGNGTAPDKINLGPYSLDINQRLDEARERYNNKVNQVREDFKAKMGVHLGSGTAGLPSNKVNLFGANVELGIAARTDFFSAIQWLFIAVASVLSLYVILGRR